jgi:uncharacterized membrane protein YqhA
MKPAVKTNWWKRGFEAALWNSRFVVLIAVVTSVLAGLDLFFVIGLESFRVLLSLVRSSDLAMGVDQKEAILRESMLRMISLIDGYLLGAFMFIFGFGMYELFLADFQAARSSPASGRILHIKSLEDLKTRLGKVILIILIVEVFKDAYDIKAHTTLDLLYIAAAIALIGLALYLTHSSAPEKKTGPQADDVPPTIEPSER